MTSLQEIFKEHAPQYLRLYENRMPENHVKAIEAIIGCRTAQSGIVVYDCPGCSQVLRLTIIDPKSPTINDLR